MKKRIQVSLDPELIKTAKQTMAQRRFGKNFSGFLEALIREEWERREQGQDKGCGTDAGCAGHPEETRFSSNEKPPFVPMLDTKPISYTKKRK